MNALFSFDLFKVYIPKCKQRCNNTWTRFDIAWLHITNNLYHCFPSYTVKQSHTSHSMISMASQINSENRSINITQPSPGIGYLSQIYLWCLSALALSVLYEGYSTNVSCTLIKYLHFWRTILYFYIFFLLHVYL
jgi:hypothetical protein